MDVGCAECSFLQQAKQLPFFTELYGLDIDRELLQKKSGKILNQLLVSWLLCAILALYFTLPGLILLLPSNSIYRLVY